MADISRIRVKSATLSSSVCTNITGRSGVGEGYIPSCIIGEDWLVEVLLYVHRNLGLLGTGAQDVHLDFHTAPELCICEEHRRRLITQLPQQQRRSR